MKHPSASFTSNPLSVLPTQRTKEFKNECVCVEGGEIFCQACLVELSLKGRGHAKNFFFKFHY